MRATSLGGLFLLVVASSGCAQASSVDPLADSSGAIVGGAVETEGSAIAQRTVLFSPRSVHGLHGCTATILDGSHALTAAHCLFGAEDVPDLVLVFATHFAEDAPMRAVTSMKAYDGGFDNDVAVLTFSGGLPPGYLPVTLADVSLGAGEDVVQAGYGQTSADSDGSDRGVLRSVTTTLRQVDGTAHRLVFSSEGHTTCNGDSGGPDFVTTPRGGLVQVGVHSTGTCSSGSSSMDVRPYLGWIRSQLAAAPAP